MHGGKHLAYSNVVVTPENIPKFTIPPSVDGSLSPCGNASLPETDGQSTHCSSGGSMLSLGGSASPRPCSYHLHHQGASQQRLLPSPTPRSRSAPVSPMRSLAERTPSSGGLVMCADDMAEDAEVASRARHTNYDPMSIAALSLPHLKMRTQFGFETLSESPHTRRKESLFHAEDGANGAGKRPSFLGRVKRKTPGEGPQIITEDADQGHPAPSSRRGKRRHNVPAVIAPLGVVLSPNARSSSVSMSRGDTFPYHHCTLVPFSSCPEFSASAAHGVTSPTTPAARRRPGDAVPVTCSAGNSLALRYRRSSLGDDAIPDPSTSPTVSPDVRWRRKSSANVPTTAELLGDYLRVDGALPGSLSKAHSSSTMSSSSSSSPCSSCRSGFSRGAADPSLGEVRLSLHYLPARRELQVGLLRAENLPGGEQLNPYVKMYLMPGKTQRQASRVVRHSANPVFNQQFTFNSIDPRLVGETRLRLKLYNKGTKLGRDELLSEFQVKLSELQPAQELRILRPLEPPTNRHVSIKLCPI